MKSLFPKVLFTIIGVGIGMYVIGAGLAFAANAFPYALGGTATTTFQTGYGIFGGSSKLTQDTTANGQFFWDNTNHRLGVGTSTPAKTLDVTSSAVESVAFRSTNSSANSLVLDNISSGSGQKNEVSFQKNRLENWSLGSDVNGNGGQNFFLYDALDDEVSALFDAATGLTLSRGLSAATTTTSMINGVVVVDGVHYPATTAGINNAINDCKALLPSCGVVMLPYGTTTLSGPIVPKSRVQIKGHGIGATVIVPYPAASGGDGDGFRVTNAVTDPYDTNITISDLTIDMSSQYPGGPLGTAVLTYSNGITLQGVDNLTVQNVRIYKPYGFGITIGTAAGALPYIKNAHISNVWIEGERNGNDSIGGGGIIGGYIENYHFLNGYGTASDITNINNFAYQNIYATRNDASYASTFADCIDTDQGAHNVTYENLFFDGCRYGMAMSSLVAATTSNITIKTGTMTNMKKGAIFFNTDAVAGALAGYEISGLNLKNWNEDGAGTQGIVLTDSLYGTVHDNVFGTQNNASYALRLNSVAATGPSNLDVHDNDFSQAAQTILLTVRGSNVSIFNNNGYTNSNLFGNIGIGLTNPGSPLTVVGSGVFQNAGGSGASLTLTDSTSYGEIQTFNGKPIILNRQGNNVGIGATTSPGSILSINGITNFTTATSTFYGTGGLNLGSGCYAIGGTCLSFTNLSGIAGISNGGTATSTQVTNGVNYFDGAKITSGTGLTFSGTTLTNNAGGIVVANGGSGASLTFTDSGTYGDIQTFNSKPLILNRQGNNIGIGPTTTPFALLSVMSNNTTSNLFAVATTTGINLYRIDQNGHIMTGGPKLTCGTGCSAVVGDDTNFRVTTGSGVTAVTVNFSNTFKNIAGTPVTPVCISSEESGGTAVSDASSTPLLVTMNLSASLTTKSLAVRCEASDNFTY